MLRRINELTCTHNKGIRTSGSRIHWPWWFDQMDDETRHMPQVVERIPRYPSDAKVVQAALDDSSVKLTRRVQHEGWRTCGRPLSGGLT